MRQLQIDDIEKFLQGISKLTYLKIEGDEEGYLVSRIPSTFWKRLWNLDWLFQILKNKKTEEWFIYYSKNKEKELLEILNNMENKDEKK